MSEANGTLGVSQDRIFVAAGDEQRFVALFQGAFITQCNT